MQQLFMLILNPIYNNFTCRIIKSTRTTIVEIALFLIIAYFYICYCSPKLFDLSYDYTLMGIVSAILLTVVIIFSIDAPLKKLKWNKGIYICWIMFGSTLLFWEIFIDLGKGFIPFIISILLLFPCLYFVWNNRNDYKQLFTSISKAVVASLILFYMLCIFLFPMIDENMYHIVRYTSAVRNPNTIGTISATAVTASLYLIGCKKYLRIPYMVVCAISISLCYYAASRTSMLAILAQLLVFALFIFNKRFTRNERKTYAKKLVLLVVTIAIVVPINKPVLELDPINKLAETHYVYAESNEAIVVDEENNSNAFLNRLKIEGKNLDELSSGRISLWKTYIDNIGISGHDEKQREFVFGPNALLAHNIFIELAYRGGLIAGLLFLIIVIYTVVYAFRELVILRRFVIHDMFIILSVVSFFIIAMLETPIFPLERDYILLYFVAIAPLFPKKQI